MTKLMNKTLVGAATLDIKALSDDGHISGYASVFGSADQSGDRIMPGAYAKTLSTGRRVKMLWQHDMREVIGGWHSLVEDEKGLYVEGGINMDVQRGREAYSLMKRGEIDGLSIGYMLPRGRGLRGKDGTCEIKEVDLYEVSVVTMPMHEMARASAKSVIECDLLVDKLAAGDRLTEREFEMLLKGTWDLSNSQAERAARIHLKGPGEPADADEVAALLRALKS